MSTTKIDIVMTTWNRKEMTEKSIRTLAKNTTTPANLIVIDNGSDNPTKDMLRELQENGMINQLVLLEENIGLEPAKNIGMQYVESNLFISTDNDCLPEPPDETDWLQKLIGLMDKHKDFGAISCRPQILVGTGDIFGDTEEDIVEFPHPGGCLRIMRTGLVNQVGGWRDEMVSRGHEEMHICGKIRELGYKTGFAVKIRCYHMFGSDGNWGYGDGKPEDHGHNPTAHPAIQNGDDLEERGQYE
jgi:GT2 family glycosyltransferase